MALLSVLTPVLALLLCLVVGYMLLKSRHAESTSGQEAKVDSRPWVDQDLQDDTEHAQREDGRQPLLFYLHLQFLVQFAPLWLEILTVYSDLSVRLLLASFYDPEITIRMKTVS